ncbi:MAG: ABC-2 family transporter protein [Clostridiaceae bacterium]|nr:ABC-2 family transporter protein [Clostridiaceae bacterium]
MQTIRQSIGLYLKSARLLVNAQMQYRTSFWLQSFSMLIMTGGELAAVLLLFTRFNCLGQWSSQEIIFFFGLMQLSFALVELFGRGFSAFSTLVRTGQFDRILLRPQSTIGGVLCSQLDPRRLGTLLVGLASLIFGSLQAQVVWTPARFVCLVFSILGGACLFLGLFIIEATLCFWSVQSIELVNILTYGGRSTCQYPLDIYPRGFRWLFLYLAPYGLTTHMPAAYILGKSIFGWPSWLAFVTPLAGVAFLLIMFIFWSFGVRHYQSTGT